MIQRFASFVTGITVCHKYIQRIKSAEMTEFDLKGTHAMCLFFLHHQTEPLTAAQLCQLCEEDKAAISRTLSVLQSRGFIEIEDRRYRAQIRLTEAGAAIADRVDELVEQWVGFGGAGLTEEERTTFYSTLERIAENLRASLEKQ